MKRLFNALCDNTKQVIETFILILCLVLPFIIDAAKVFLPYTQENTPEPSNIILIGAIKVGNWAIALVLFIIILWRIRSHNKDYIMNESNRYHDYPYSWYWYCSKILGIMKCNLVLVPIYMQFLLVIRNTFAEYPLHEEDYPIIESERSSVSVINQNASESEINLILEDTYPIVDIPATKRQLKTIKILRSDSDNCGRHFSEQFIEEIINAVRKENEDITINIFATTNPMNTLNIARRVFMTANRANVKHLYVFQQNKNMASNRRKFENYGHKIY